MLSCTSTVDALARFTILLADQHATAVSSKLHLFEDRGSTNPSTRRHNRIIFPPLFECPSEQQSKVLT